MKYGDRVRIISAPGAMPEFVGSVGTIIGEERDGGTRMFRVHLDTPIVINGIGPVTDDLWSSAHLRKVRR